MQVREEKIREIKEVLEVPIQEASRQRYSLPIY